MLSSNEPWENVSSFTTSYHMKSFNALHQRDLIILESLRTKNRSSTATTMADRYSSKESKSRNSRELLDEFHNVQ